MFRYHFLGHFLAELIDIWCGSLLNSILKTYRWKFLIRHFEYVFTQKNLKCCHILCFSIFFIKNVIFNKSKNASVGFFIYMSSMYVQRVTVFEEAV